MSVVGVLEYSVAGWRPAESPFIRNKPGCDTKLSPSLSLILLKTLVESFSGAHLSGSGLAAFSSCPWGHIPGTRVVSGHQNDFGRQR